MQIAATLKGSVRRHPARWGVVGLAAGGLVAFILYWFAPWNLIVDQRVDEAIPAGVVAEDPAGADEDVGAPAADGVPTDEGAAPSEPVTLASGEFRSLEHPTTGVALIL